MSDQRSVMKEFRFLDQKRQTTGLSAEEATRYAQLRDLVGPDTAAPPRAGFDVNAAAARLRESLLPGGLRGQVPAADLSPEPPPEPEVEVAPEATALEAAWEAQPFAPLDVEPAPAADPLFDPASMGSEVRPQAWNPEAPGYDPNAPYDEAAWIAAGYDPNATYDWSAYEPDGQAPQPEAGPAEAQPEEAPLEEPLPEEPPFDVTVAPAAPLEAAEVAAFPAEEAGAVELTEELVAEEGLAVEPSGAGPDAAELPFDPNAPFDHAKWFGRASTQAPQGAPAELAEPYDAAALELGAVATGLPEPEPVEPALAPEPTPAAEAEAAWAAADVAQPIEIAEEADFEAAPDATYAADPGQADPYALEAAEALASAPALPYAVEAPEPYAAVPATGFEPAADGAAWSEAAPEPLDLGEPAAETSPEPLLLPEEGELPPAATPEAAWFDATTEPPPAPALAFGDYDADARGVPAGLAAMMIEPLPEPPAPAADAGEPVGDGSATPYQAAPEGAAFGEYDESAPGSAPALALEEAAFSALPFDPAAASVIAPGELPEGYDAGGPTLDPASLPPPAAGEYDQAAFPADASYGGPEGDSLPGGTPLELGEPVQDWLPEQALEQGFELASDGSFGELDRPVLTPVPGWATVEEVAAATAAAAPATAWESPPALDLSAPFDLPLPAAAPEAAPGPLAEAPPEVAFEPLAEQPVDELPILAAEDILEELPPVAEPLLEAIEPAPAPEAAPEPTAEYEPIAAPEPDAEAAYAEALAAAEPPSDGEIPPEIAAAFGDAPVEADPFAAAGAGLAGPAIAVPADPSAPPLAEAYAEPPAASPLLAEPPLASGPAFGAGEPEPIVEEAPEPVASVEPEPLPGPEAAPQVWIEGSHRVVLHTVDGQVKRGLLVDAALDAVELALQPQGPGTPERVGTDNVKAIFFMLAPGEKAAAPVGKKVRVTFRDGRQVAGYSPDYVEGTIGFFMIPADTRTNTGRIWVYQSAVRQVTVS